MSKQQNKKGNHQPFKQKSKEQKIQRQRDRKSDGRNFSSFIETADSSKPDEESPEKINSASIEEVQTKTVLSNNWERYQRSNSDEEVYEKAANFEDLLRNTCGTVNYFKFKSEKHWNEVKTNQKFDKYFSIDLNLLNTNLLTIPAYERLDIDKSLLTAQTVSAMELEAQTQQQILNSDLSFRKVVQKDSSIDKLETKLGQCTTQKKSTPNPSCDALESDKIKLEMIHPVKIIKTEEHPRTEENRNLSENTKDLEQWLEDLLDD